MQTRAGRRVGGEEILLVIQTLEETPRTYYVLAWSPGPVTTAELIRGHSERHRVEETFQEGKGEVGLAHYEVRSWTGWHHHMTLCFLAMFFLVLERLRVGKKKSGHHSVPGPSDPGRTASPPPANACRNRPESKRSPAA